MQKKVENTFIEGVVLGPGNERRMLESYLEGRISWQKILSGTTQ